MRSAGTDVVGGNRDVVSSHSIWGMQLLVPDPGVCLRCGTPHIYGGHEYISALCIYGCMCVFIK